MPKELPLKRLLYITTFQVENFLTLMDRINKQFMKFTPVLVFLLRKTKI